jgi:8-oxo-dGTP pyrophosphatase MutT (NUDIX family)
MRFEFSAGGIVYKKDQDNILKQVQDDIKILVCQHSQHHGWVFPKGLIDDHVKGQKKSASAKGFGETKEEAAIREVREETGVFAKIIEPLTPVSYWYNFEGEKIKKTVYYFLMEYVSGDTKDHDFEMENVEWLIMDAVDERLTYKSDREVWKQARQKIPNSKHQILNKSQ